MSVSLWSARTGWATLVGKSACEYESEKGKLTMPAAPPPTIAIRLGWIRVSAILRYMFTEH